MRYHIKGMNDDFNTAFKFVSYYRSCSIHIDYTDKIGKAIHL
jgi:hypothetical protein